jgi:hypothetical protein
MTAGIALDPELAAFIQGGVSIHAASRSASRVPNLSRALGSRLSADRRRVTVFLLASHSRAMLDDFRGNGRIAVVFSLPSSHRTVQLKGDDAALETLQEGDCDLVAKNRAGFTADLVSVGYPPTLGKMLTSGLLDDVVAVGFTVAGAYEQTPGPAAGTAIVK